MVSVPLALLVRHRTPGRGAPADGRSRVALSAVAGSASFSVQAAREEALASAA